MSLSVSNRTLPVFFCAVLLASCASAPRQLPVSGGMSDTLKLCAGMGVSNAPKTNAHREVVNYEPYVRVGGVSLARAPVRACLSSGYGPRRGGAGSFHEGVDLYTGSPADIYAGGDGTVEAIEVLRGYGRTVLIRHSASVKTRYAHLSSYARGLRPGDKVRQGDYIGATGSSGNATAVHLHYEILINGRPHNPITVNG